MTLLNQQRINYLLFTILFLAIGYCLNSVYRPYAYTNNLTDFGLADAGNNLIFVPGIYFLLLLVHNKPFVDYWTDILIILGFYILVEILQLVNLVPGTFDWKDICALSIGAMLTMILTNSLHSKMMK